MTEKEKEKNKLVAGIMAAGGVVFVMMAAGTVIYHYLEGWSWISSLYFTVVTMATVGYGDLTPTSDFSRLVTVFFILFGVTIAVASITFLGGQYLARREAKIEERRIEKEKARQAE